MRDVGRRRRVVAVRQTRTSAQHDEHNEVEMLMPVCARRSTRSASPSDDIGFICSGSLDYLPAGRSRFVSALDAVGAWPPIRERHVEMDGAWALYEAWVALQTGEVDTALVYGFGKSSPGDLREIMTLQLDPYYVAPLWPRLVDARRAAGPRAASTPGDATESDLAEVAARSRRNAHGQPARPAARATSVGRRCCRASHVVAPLRDARLPARSPTAPPRSCSRPATVARELCERPGVDPRHRPPHRAARASACATSPRSRVDRAGRARRPASATARSTSPSCTRRSATRS